MRISDWSSDVCSSDLVEPGAGEVQVQHGVVAAVAAPVDPRVVFVEHVELDGAQRRLRLGHQPPQAAEATGVRSEEHTSELQSLMRISYAVFCLKKKKKKIKRKPIPIITQ